MEVRRGEVWWADVGEPRGSTPGYRRPVVVVQADSFNRSRVQTVVVVAVTSNLQLVAAPGNVLLSKGGTGLPKDSVANVSQVITLNKDDLAERSGKLPARLLRAIDAGLRLVLGL